MTGEASGERVADGTLAIQVIGNVARLTLDRPSHRNAVSAAMFRALRAAVEGFAGDERVRVIELRSALPGMFCAGADIASLADPSREALAAGFELLEDCVRALRASPKPVVVLVDGDCFGAGCAFAAGADVVLATEPSRFSLPEMHLDLAPVLAVAALAPVVQARKLVLWAATGRFFTARDACDAGLVSEVVAPDHLEEAAATLAAELARPTTFTFGRFKRALDILRDGAADREHALFETMLETATHPSTQAAVAAFLARKRDKRR